MRKEIRIVLSSSILFIVSFHIYYWESIDTICKQKIWTDAPLSPQQPATTKPPPPLHNLFHFILTTKNNFDWKMARSIETVFYHHPEARVWLHSNTLDQNHWRIQAFLAKNYKLEVRPYNLTQMVLESVSWNITSQEEVEEFLYRQLPSHQHRKVWKVQQSDLLRFLLVYKYGGIYFDLDMYVQRPIPDSLKNAIARQAPDGLMNCNALIFDKHHPFLHSTLHELVSNFERRKKVWGQTGPNLVTSVYKKNQHLQVQILDYPSFQPLAYTNMDDCFTKPLHDLDLSLTYAFHTNNQVSKRYNATKKGTLCDRIYHQYCLVFCGEGHEK